MSTPEQIKNNNLHQLIIRSDEIHEIFAQGFAFEDLGKMTKECEELKKIVEITQQVTAMIQSNLTKVTSLFAMRCNGFRSMLEIVDDVNHLESDRDFNPIISTSKMKSLITPNSNHEIVAPNISIPVIRINSLADLPNSNLYYIKSIGEFAIKINGCMFKGNIGNIINNSSHYKNNKANRKIVTDCFYGDKCTFLNKGTCDFYHDPLDYNDFTENTLNHRKKHNIHTRNFLSQSWLYTSEAFSPKNKHLRHIGDKDELSSDIYLINKSEKRRRQSQTMHDILIALSIDNQWHG